MQQNLATETLYFALNILIIDYVAVIIDYVAVI